MYDDSIEKVNRISYNDRIRNKVNKQQLKELSKRIDKLENVVKELSQYIAALKEAKD